MERTALQKLREQVDVGQIIIGGVAYEFRPKEAIVDGDQYVAAFNTGPHLLTARDVNTESGWIVPVERAYSFDIPCCVKVVRVDQ